MTDFEFKPITDGLGFHREGQSPVDLELNTKDDGFSFSALSEPLVGSAGQTSKENEELKEAAASLKDPATSFTPKPLTREPLGTIKHNSKVVSDLIAALPPAFDFMDEPEKSGRAKGRGKESLFGGANVGMTFNSPVEARSTFSDLFGGNASAEKPQLGKTSARVESESVGATASSSAGSAFLKMPLGREDYKKSQASLNVSAAISAAAQAATLTGAVSGNTSGSFGGLDENIAKMSKAFPHIGKLAGQPAAQTLRQTSYSAGAEIAPTLATPAVMTEVAISQHFGSAILDALVVLGLGCVMLAVVLGITNVNLLALLENTKTDIDTVFLLATLFVSSALLYCLAARSFLGATLGEWSYEIRVGDAKHRGSWYYPLAVLWRSVLAAATGFVLVPILSALFDKDLFQSLTGLQLVSVGANSRTE